MAKLSLPFRRMIPWPTCVKRLPRRATTPQPRLRVPGSIPKAIMSKVPSISIGQRWKERPALVTAPRQWLQCALLLSNFSGLGRCGGAADPPQGPGGFGLLLLEIVGRLRWHVGTRLEENQSPEVAPRGAFGVFPGTQLGGLGSRLALMPGFVPRTKMLSRMRGQG